MIAAAAAAEEDGGEEDANGREAEGLGVGFDEQRGEERPRHEREAERHAELDPQSDQHGK